MAIVKKKPRRLCSIKVDEVSLVDKAANKRSFLLYKRDGGEENMNKELIELQKRFDETVEERDKLVQETEENQEVLEEKTKEVEDLNEKVDGLTKKLEEAKKVVPIKKSDLTGEQLLSDLLEIIDVSKTGKKISTSNLEKIKNAHSALADLISQVETQKSKEDSEELQKQFDALPKEKQEEVATMLNKMNETLDSKIPKA